MIDNYFKTALRFLKQNKLFAGINMFGLSIALAVSFIILLYVINELSYDNCHRNRKRVYRVLNYYPDIKSTGTSAPFVLGTMIKEKFPQVEKAIRIIPLSFTFKTPKGSITETALSTDSDIFDIFTLPLLEDSQKLNPLEAKNSMVISLDLAKKLFGNQNVIGKQIVAQTFSGEQIFTVNGVFENIPENSTFRTECIVNSRWSIDYINKKYSIVNAETSWLQDFWYTWVLLSNNCDIQSLSNQINTISSKKISGRPASIYSFQNLSNVYLGSVVSGIHGNSSSVKVFSALALLITIVAAINYIILSVAISTGRTKEIAIRKAFGSSIMKIRNQFLSESLLMVAMVLPFALLLMFVLMPIAGSLLHTNLHIMNANIIIYIVSFILLIILIGILSGIYTSSYLSKMNVLEIMNNVSYSTKRKYFSRSVLIVLQLIIFCSFMSGALIIRSQYNYMINKDMGFNTKNIILLKLGRDFYGYSSYLNIIKTYPNVINAAGTDDKIPLEGKYSRAAVGIPNSDNKEIQVLVNLMIVDFGFLQTMGMSILQGRDFSEEYGGDISKSVILNETAVRQLGITNPVGKLSGGEMTIGIVKDFNLFSLYTEISPISILIIPGPKEQIAVHYKAGTLASILPLMETEWKKVAPDRPFEYKTIESIVENLYASEKNLNIVVSIFSFLTLIIAAFGLFGLTLFLARSRTREIGIKKVFGSSETNIIISSLHENLILVIIASIASIPTTLYSVSHWLSRFAFRININWWIFVLTFLTAAIVVLLTVYYHSYKMSRINPVHALKYV
jgi:putative ABC transport system permease protein